MTINLQTGGFQIPQVLPGARSADVHPGDQNSTSDTPASAAPLAQASAGAGQGRQPQPSTNYEKVVAAIQKVAPDVYPVSDRSFTIFKDESGQYITRYTSLRDGKVTYIPEIRLLQLFDSQQHQDARLELKA